MNAFVTEILRYVIIDLIVQKTAIHLGKLMNIAGGGINENQG